MQAADLPRFGASDTLTDGTLRADPTPKAGQVAGCFRWGCDPGEDEIPVKLGLTIMALAFLLQLVPGSSQEPSAPQAQTAVPDAPAPQPPPPLTGATGVNGPITPGKGDEEVTPPASSSSTTSVPQPASSSQAPTPEGKDEIQTAPPELPAAGQGMAAVKSDIILDVNFVEVPVTVKDSKGHLVAGLTFRDFKVFENNERMPLRLFTVDPAPLSVAFVIDQSLTSDVMAKVNTSLGAIQGALTSYDEVAVFSYNHGAQERTGFTGAQSARLPAVLALTKETGSDMLVPVNSGPLAGCNIRENGACVDPNLQPGRSAGSANGVITIPKEIHTLNDAILSAAKELSTRPKGRRRIIYVISDGKENGSKASYRDVLRYLETNKIAVYGTAVGDSARWGEGYIDRFHIPFTPYENLLIKYTQATGGTLDSERDSNGIEKSYAKIAEEARNQYTLGYLSHQPIIDGKFRKIEVRVDRPGLEVFSKLGYYPSAQDSR
jgi:VWFA-related protein